MTDSSAPGFVVGGRSPFRWRSGTMMIVVAAVAVCCRWPFAALGMAVMTGGPVVGGWLRRNRGDEGVIEGSILGGVASYPLMFVVSLLILAATDARSFDVARVPQLLALVILGIGSSVVVGVIVGMLMAALLQIGVAIVRERKRRRQAALDWEQLAKPDGSEP